MTSDTTSANERANAEKRLRVDAHASPTAYFALAAFWIAMGMFYPFLAILKDRPQLWTGAAIALAVGVLWIAWIRGFRLTIDEQQLVYRDGIYRSTKVPLGTINNVRSARVGWTPVDFGLKFPRLVITYGSGRRLAINTKLFRRHDIQNVVSLLDEIGERHKP